MILCVSHDVDLVLDGWASEWRNGKLCVAFT